MRVPIDAQAGLAFAAASTRCARYRPATSASAPPGGAVIRHDDIALQVTEAPRLRMVMYVPVLDAD
ncbi:hypothetical protein [uncultured Ralstonia sp.]|uniref:hypothetical protein n=1 Tax=Ralstonia sp. TaxID=54061 RepID=UPI001EA9E400|nr:hypothetical protein [uncultured Ralstonia sp.]UCF25382.1 MAG: hypothetical protein JSV72_08335 [Ralstonia sp.]